MQVCKFEDPRLKANTVLHNVIETAIRIAAIQKVFALWKATMAQSS